MKACYVARPYKNKWYQIYLVNESIDVDRLICEVYDEEDAVKITKLLNYSLNNLNT